MVNILRLFFLFLILFTFKAVASEYDGHWEGINKCSNNSVVAFKIKDGKTKTAFNNGNTRTNYAGKTFKKFGSNKIKLGLNSNSGRIEGEFISLNKLVFDKGTSCEFTVSKMQSSNTDPQYTNETISNLSYCVNKSYNRVYFLIDRECFSNHKEVTKNEFDNYKSCQPGGANSYKTPLPYCDGAREISNLEFYQINELPLFDSNFCIIYPKASSCVEKNDTSFKWESSENAKKTVFNEDYNNTKITCTDKDGNVYSRDKSIYKSCDELFKKISNNNLIAKKEKKESNKKNILINSNSNSNIKFYAIAKYDIRIKEEDDIWSRNIGEVKKGQRIEIIDGINDIYASSYKIKHNNKIGYITKSLVQEEFGVLKNISKNNKKINYDKIFYCKEADGNVVSYKNGCYNLLEISKEEYDKQKKNKKISNKVVKKILEKPEFKKTKDVYFCINPKNGKIAEYKYGCYGLDEISEDEYLYAKNNRRINKNNLNKNKQDKKQSIQVAEDNSPPSIIISDKFTADENLTASIKGKIVDDSDIALITVDGYEVSLLNGEFRKDLFVKKGGRSIEIVSFDVHGNKSSKVVIIERQSISVAENIFDFLDPRKLIVDKNKNAAALIIGVESYKNTFTAPFASNDALMFSDFAQMSLGVPRNKIEILTNENADQNNTLKTVIKWLPKVIKEDETDLYVFFSGHGLASPDGEDLFLLPFDGDPEILEFSALMRNELFNQISKLNPRSVTVFLDTCYSGATRSNEILIASAKPIYIVAQEQNIPTNFTVFSASSNNEIATVLEEAEHGLFSYFMMKGLEGEADTNNDRTITNGELHAFINKNVSRQANQTPQLNGDPEQVLVKW